MLGTAYEWGTLGEWASGIGALAAVIVALVIAERSHRRDINLRKEDDERRNRDTELRDLDETRRLLVIAMSTRPDERLNANFIGTAAHALARHSEIAKLDEAIYNIQSYDINRSQPDRDTINNYITAIDARMKALS